MVKKAEIEILKQFLELVKFSFEFQIKQNDLMNSFEMYQRLMKYCRFTNVPPIWVGPSGPRASTPSFN